MSTYIPRVLLQGCLNGPRGADEHPALPVTAERLAADAYACATAGAGAIHCHPRDADGPDFSPPPGVPRDEAVDLFANLQWSAYCAIGDWACAQPDADEERLLGVFMDFLWVGLERFREGRHWQRSSARAREI